MRFFALLSTLLCTGISIADEVKILTWEFYLSDAVIEQFEKQTGHQVTQVFFNVESERDQIISSGRGAAYDLAIVESVALQILEKQEYVHTLKDFREQHAKYYDPIYFDSCGESGIPYSWGTTGIMFRSSVSPTVIDSWSQLFNPPSEHSGTVVMNMDQMDAVGAALLASGLPPFSESSAELKIAYQQLLNQQTHLAGTGVLATSEVFSKFPQMSLGLAFSGESYWFNENTAFDDWVYVVPNEGTMLWIECWSVPNNNPISDASYEFLKFIQDPKIAAQNAQDVWLSTPNVEALKYANDEYLNDSELFPSQEILDKSHPYRLLDKNSLTLRTRILSSLDR